MWSKWLQNWMKKDKSIITMSIQNASQWFVTKRWKKSTIVIQTGGYATDFALEIGNDNDKI